MNDYMLERVDYKRFVLINIKRIWIIIAGAVIGAALFALGYYVKNTILASEPMYRNDAMYHIVFDVDRYELTQHYYNDYTWNDVIDSDKIAGVAAKKLNMDQTDIYEMTDVPTMSDITYFHLYVDAKEPELADKVQDALTDVLVEFAAEDEDFVSITRMDLNEASKIEKDNLSLRTTVAGGVIGLLFGFLLMCLLSAMDDAVYTIRDAKRIADVPVFYAFEEDKITEAKAKLSIDDKMIIKVPFGKKGANGIAKDAECKQVSMIIIEGDSEAFAKRYYGNLGE